jgi:hypothetical protein
MCKADAKIQEVSGFSLAVLFASTHFHLFEREATSTLKYIFSAILDNNDKLQSCIWLREHSSRCHFDIESTMAWLVKSATVHWDYTCKGLVGVCFALLDEPSGGAGIF